MSGILGAAISGGFRPTLASQSILTPSTTGSRIAGVHFFSTGILQSVTGNSGAPTDTDIPGQWCVPQGSALNPGQFFELFTTLVSGSLTSGGAFIGSWTDLEAFAPLFSVTRSGFGVASATIGCTIRNKTTLQTYPTADIDLIVTAPP